jgi:hypothetical protein
VFTSLALDMYWKNNGRRGHGHGSRVTAATAAAGHGHRDWDQKHIVWPVQQSLCTWYLRKIKMIDS